VRKSGQWRKRRNRRHVSSMNWCLCGVIALGLGTGQALAQCGPDPAPPQAALHGYTCETYRWGGGDTASEIDSGKTYAPGFKWYWGTANINGHATVASDYSLQPNGKIVSQTSVPADHGKFVLNTCGAAMPATGYTVGKFFQHGWYLEFVGEWNATGHPSVQAGFYGIDQYGIPALQWEVDIPDAMAFDQAVADWRGGTPGVQGNTGHTFFAPSVETGTNRYGAMSTSTDVTWWHNDTANGTVNFGGGPTDALNVYNAKFCFGNESTSQFPMTIDSVKVWQTPPPGVPNGGGGKMMHRR
jgi:hypothetical protein